MTSSTVRRPIGASICRIPFSAVLSVMAALFAFALLGIVLFGASDDSAAKPVSGTCGDDLTWSVDPSGNLTIQGSGAMYDFTASDVLWGGNTVNSVSLPDGLTYIGARAFYNTAITSLAIPDSVTGIGDAATYYCSDLRTVTIPAPFTGNLSNQFFMCSSLQSITVSEDNTRYRSVDGILFSKDGNTLEHYPQGREDTVYSVPEGVLTMNADFRGITHLSVINIPASVTVIGLYTLRQCGPLTAINVDGANQTYSSVDGVLFSKDGTRLIQYPSGKQDSSYVIPASVSTVDNFAFMECNSLGTVTVPDSVSDIGRAFTQCTSLQGITLPSTLTAIGNDAFEWCEGLTSVTMPEGIVSVGNNAFLWCSNLRTVVLPSTLTSIGDAAFYGCALSTVTIPDSVTSIGRSAFYGNNRLETVDFQGSAAEFDETVFAMCGALSSFSASPSNTEYSSVDGVLFSKDGTGLLLYPVARPGTSYAVPDTVTGIGGLAFRGSIHLESISIPGTVTRIKDNPFLFSQSLRSIEVDPSNTAYASDGGVLYNKDGTQLLYYPSCREGTTYTILDTVTYISPLAFIGADSLTDIEVRTWNSTFLSEGGIVYSEDGTTLVVCPSGLRKVVLPDTVTLVLSGALSGHNLKEVVFPAGSAVTVQEASFFDCELLRQLTVGDGASVTFEPFAMYLSTAILPVLYVDAPEGFAIDEYSMMYIVEVIEGRCPVPTVTFRSEGEVFFQYESSDGETVELPSGTPEKAADSQYTYGFSHWEGYTDGMLVDGDMEFDAVFTETYVRYIITFMSQGQEYAKRTLYYQNTIVLPDDPVKASDDTYDYPFIGWDGYSAGMKVTQSVTFTALFDDVYREYSVVFSANGQTVSDTTLHYGDTIQAPAQTPVRGSDGKFDYAFSGWQGYTAGMTVAGNHTFTALFTKFAITEKDGSGAYTVEVSDPYVSFSGTKMAEIVGQAAEDVNVTVTVSVGGGKVAFDNAAVRVLKGEEAELVLNRLSADEMTSSVKEIVGDNPVFSISFGDNKSFGEGKVTVTVPYALEDGRDPGNLKIYYIADGRVAEEMVCTYDNGTVTFTTNHFSDYAVMYVEPESEKKEFPVMYAAIGAVAVLALVGAVIFLRGRS